MLDLCCGPGRHSAPLSKAGYRVVGLDQDRAALVDSSAGAPEAAFVRGDMRQLPFASRSFEATICMWQSFGQFDDAGNSDVLVELTRVLAPNGLLVMDLYHRDAVRESERIIERDGERIHESRVMRRDRLFVHLRYSTGEEDSFEWRLFTPATLAGVAEDVGLEMILACAEFDESIRASGEYARMQIVFRAG